MDHFLPPWLVKPFLSYAKQHPIHAACYCLLGGVATFKFTSFLYLRVRSSYLHPKDPHDKLHSYPHPTKPKLPHGNKSMAYLADIQDSEAGIALLHEIKRSQSFLTLHSPGVGGEEEEANHHQQQQGLSLSDSPSRLLRPEADVLQFMQDISRLGDMLKTHHKIYLHSLMTSRVLEEGDTLMTAGQDAVDGLHLIVSGRLGVVDDCGSGGSGGRSSSGSGGGGSPPPSVSRSASHPTLSHSFSYYAWEGADTFGSTFGGGGGAGGGEGGEGSYGQDNEEDEDTPTSKWGGDLLCVFEAGTSLGENAVFAGGLPFFSSGTGGSSTGNSVGAMGMGDGGGDSSGSGSGTGVGGGAGALSIPPWQTPPSMPPQPPSSSPIQPPPASASSPHWLPFLGSTRPSTVVALEPTAVLTLSAPAFSRFSATYPEAAMSLILESTCRQWRVANNLLVDYFMLEDAWRASLEPPGSDPAFSFSAPADAGAGGVGGHTPTPTTSTTPGLSPPPPLFPSSSSSFLDRGGGVGWGTAAATPSSPEFSSPPQLSSSSSSSSALPPSSKHSRPAYAPPVCLPIQDVEAAADEVITLPPGTPVYCEGDDSDALYLVLEGFGSCWHLASQQWGGGGKGGVNNHKKGGRRGGGGGGGNGRPPTSSSNGGSGGPPRPIGMPNITPSEFVSLAKAAAGAAASAVAGGGVVGAKAVGGSKPPSSSSLPLPPTTLFRFVGPGCLSGGPACLNLLPHRETLLSITPMRLAVFKRSTFAALASSESGGGGVWGVGVGGPSSSSSSSSIAPFYSSSHPLTPPSSPNPAHAASSSSFSSNTPRPFLLPSSPPGVPLPPSAQHHSHKQHTTTTTTLPIPLVQLHVALAVARTMVALPRMLLTLGMRRTWAACGESIFTEGDASNGMYFIVSGRVRCEMRAGKRLGHFSSPHPYPPPPNPSPTTPSASGTTSNGGGGSSSSGGRFLPTPSSSFSSKKRTGLSMFGGAAAAAGGGGGGVGGGGKPSNLLSPMSTSPTSSSSISSAPIPLTTPAAPFLVHFDVPAGGTVGELSVLAKETTRASTAYAARDCELVHISAQSFARLASTYASVYEHFTAALAKRVGDTTRALVRGGGGWGASSGAPGFLGVEKAVGIPFSLPAPPPPSLTLGGGGYNHNGGGGREGGGGRRRGGGGLRWRKYKYTAAATAAAAGAAAAGVGATPDKSSSSTAPATLFLPPTPPTTINQAWSSVHPSLVPLHPCAPSFSTLTLVSGGGTPLPKGALAAFAVRLGEALAAAAAGEEEDGEGGGGGGGGATPVSVVTLGTMEEVLGKGASLALELSYGRSRASAWLAGVEERARFTLLVAEDNGGGSGGGGGGVSGRERRRVRFTGDDDAPLSPIFATAATAGGGGGGGGGGGDPEMNWARLCMQHSDMVLVVGEGGGHPGLSRLERTLLFSPSGPMHLARVDLVLLHAPGVPPKGTRAWFSSNNAPPGLALQQQQGGVGGGGGEGSDEISEGWTREITHHHHIRGMGSSNAAPASAAAAATASTSSSSSSSAAAATATTSGDVARLARFITGRAVGVVLGGGGSRGLAHLGLLKQLVARGIPIDVIGGASQGCFMAAAWATTESIAGMTTKVASLAASVGSTFNIIRALTLPLVSLTSGAHFDDLIRSALGGVQIEDIAGPRFFAVSLNATDGALAVHSAGPLWRYVRASMGVLKLLPPVFDRETKRLLVDGGYVSNLPVDVCHAAFPGTVGLVFACDVENKDSTANWLDISEADYGGGGALGGGEDPSGGGVATTTSTSTSTSTGGGGMWGALTRGGNPDSLELSGWWVAWRATLAALGLGPPMRIPYTDDLFLQVSYMMHYSSLRTLLSEEGYDGAMKEPQGGGGGGVGTYGGQHQDTLSREHRKPALCYIRPKVGKFGLLDYHLMGKIVEIGEEAAEQALKVWERRWEALKG